MGKYAPTLTLLTFSPLLLLFNDFILQPLPRPHPYIGCDDVFKALIWTPFSLYILSKLTLLTNPTPSSFHSHISTILSGLYVYGFGINHSTNACSNYLQNHGSKTPDIVHWYDEICGHYVIVIVYALVQLYWMLTGLREEVVKKYDYVKIIAVFGGYMSSLLILESRGVEVMIPLDIIIVAVSLKRGPRELGEYCRANSLVHLGVWVAWYGRFGRWVEPSELKGMGWDPVDIFFGGMISMRSFS